MERGDTGHSGTGEMETVATRSALPAGSFSDMTQLSHSARETMPAGVGGEEKEYAEVGQKKGGISAVVYATTCGTIAGDVFILIVDKQCLYNLP